MTYHVRIGTNAEKSVPNAWNPGLSRILIFMNIYEMLDTGSMRAI